MATPFSGLSLALSFSCFGFGFLRVSLILRDARTVKGPRSCKLRPLRSVAPLDKRFLSSHRLKSQDCVSLDPILVPRPITVVGGRHIPTGQGQRVSSQLCPGWVNPLEIERLKWKGGDVFPEQMKVGLSEGAGVDAGQTNAMAAQ